MTNLNNLRILITRPEPQANELCRLIVEKGGQAIHFPTLAFAPPPNEQAFERAISQLGEQDWLVFISPQAVYSSVTHIRRAWPHFPASVRFAALGGGTAKALREAGYQAAVFPDKQQNSDSLLALSEFQSIKNLKIAIIRGLGGREIVDQTLAERGAQILSVIAYQRVLPDIDNTQINNLLRQHEIDVIVCTSFESIFNLKKLLEDCWSHLQNIPLIVVSERIKMLAQDLGFRRIWVTHNASQSAILDCVDVVSQLKKI